MYFLSFIYQKKFYKTTEVLLLYITLECFIQESTDVFITHVENHWKTSNTD